MAIGPFIREEVLPQGMSVTEAAKRLGVARSSLSRLLNGHASLSYEMALRLEQAFGKDHRKLLRVQSEAHRERRSEEAKSVALHAYAPPFLNITARKIADWATGNNKEAQHQLPVLLRRLINSTGRELHRVDFPGGDNAQRSGWDGWVEANAATPWIPEGKSGWEFSTEQRPRAKADRDYAARLGIDAPERSECTFVFVTTCNWPRKNHWYKGMQARREWKAVRAYDASDLEQWLEASISGQVWLAEKLGIPTEGVETLAQSWDRWANASKWRMTAKIFEPSLNAHRDKFKERLDSDPGERPLAIAADSKDEAIAFLACLFEDSGGLASHQNQAVVFKSAQTLRSLASTSTPFIPIAYSDDAERELANVYRERHCIVIRPRNAVDPEPDIALDLLGQEAFETALTDMGIPQEIFDRLSRESGRSPTVLRRRLSPIDAIRKPQWAEDQETGRRLIPIVMVGAWHTDSEADREILAKLSGGCYSKVEETITDLRSVEDPPVWSISKFRGVVSKIDALFAISELLTEEDLRGFQKIAKHVLSERDPSLDLPEDQRWAAAVYDKIRSHSPTLRSGICETLVLLSVHGNALFQHRIGLDVQWLVSSLIGDLLRPLTIDKLLSHESDLPRYAEAAPTEFLSLLDEDLRQPSPVVLGLLKPVDSSVFSNCPRTGLLWALECMAWNPRYLARVSRILAELSKIEITDNWANTPIASLGAIYRFWFPQTAAPLDLRVKGLEMLVRKFPDIGWEICMQQFGPGRQFGMHAYRPRWRADASGAGQVTSEQEGFAFARKALDVGLSWAHPYDSSKLGDLVDRLNEIPSEDEPAVWEQINKWSHIETKQVEKAKLREHIRRVVLVRRRATLTPETRDLAFAAYAKLEPSDVVLRHSWLFAKEWVDVPEEEWIRGSTTTPEEDQFDLDKEEQWVHAHRTAAMNEIWAKREFDGFISLLADSDAPFLIGRYAAMSMTDLNAACSVITSCLANKVYPRQRIEAFMRGFIGNAIERKGRTLLLNVSATSTADQKARLFACAPFDSGTWRLLDHEEQSIRDGYWRDVHPYRNRHSETEVNEFLDRLLDAERPLEAFHAVQWEWKKIETSRFKRLMMMMATTHDKSDYSYKPDRYCISHALKELDGRADVSEAEMARLELIFIDALDDEEHGIPNLERQIEAQPALFVECLALLFKRDDDGQDPPSWQIKNSDQRTAAATNAYRLLGRLRRIPGTETSGKVAVEKLQRWVTEVRRLCAEHGRPEVGDHQIGQLLIHAPSDEDGVWPCRSVCEVMETVQSEQMGYGFHLGVNNARGVHMRGEGGNQEREISAKYRALARRVDFEYPYVSSVLEGIARGYDVEARQEDSAADVRRRLVI